MYKCAKKRGGGTDAARNNEMTAGGEGGEGGAGGKWLVAMKLASRRRKREGEEGFGVGAWEGFLGWGWGLSDLASVVGG